MGFRQRRGFNDPWVQTGTFKHEHDNGVGDNRHGMRYEHDKEHAVRYKHDKETCDTRFLTEVAIFVAGMLWENCP